MFQTHVSLFYCLLIICRDEQRQYAIKRAQLGKHEKSMSDDYNQDNEIYPSLAILFSAHDFLGKFLIYSHS